MEAVNISHNSLMHPITRVYGWVTKPSSTLEMDTASWRKAQLLSTMLFVVIVLVSLLNAPTFTGKNIAQFTLPEIGGYAFLGLAYLLSRTRYYYIAAMIVTLVFSFVSLGLIITGNSESPHTTLGFLLLALLLGSILLSKQGVMLLAAINIVIIFILTQAVPTIFPETAVVVTTLVVHGLGAILAIIFMHHRDLVEQDRQRVLQETIDKRSQALETAQTQLIKKERLAVLGELAGGMAHELRNPLSVITNSVYLLREVSTDAPDIVQEYLQIIDGRVQEAVRMVSDLLDFTETQLPSREYKLFSELIDDVLTQHVPSMLIQVTISNLSDLPAVFVDGQQIKLVLEHLVLNAYQAMEMGGLLSISGRVRGKNVEILIKDSGTGIPANEINKIFEPLFSTKTHGLGLGLPIAKKLVTLNEGTITVKSTEGLGTIFQVELPMTQNTSWPGTLKSIQASRKI